MILIKDLGFQFELQTTGKGVATLTGIKLPEAFGGRTQDICLTGDIICTGSGGMMAHLKYGGSKFEKDAVQYSAKILSGGSGESAPKSGAAGGEAPAPAAEEAPKAGGGLAALLGGGGGGKPGGKGGGGGGGGSGGGLAALLGGGGGGGGAGGLAAMMGGGKRRRA